MAIGKEIDKFVNTFLATYKLVGDNARRDRLFDLEEKKLKGSEDASRLYAEALKAQNEWFARYSGGAGAGRSGASSGGASSGGASSGGKVSIDDVYNAFRGAGFSHNQARSLTAEVGRENDFQAKFIYGTHADPKNGKTNVGMLSFQGPRQVALMDHLRKAGRVDESGRILPGPESLLEQAKFYKQEMPKYARAKREFLDNPNVDPDTAARVLGRYYIKWDYSNPEYAGHHERRRGYLRQIPSDAPAPRAALPVTPASAPAAPPAAPVAPVAPAAPAAPQDTPQDAEQAAPPAALPSMTGQPLPRMSSNAAEPENEQTAQSEQALEFDDAQYAATGGMIDPSHHDVIGAALHDVQSSIGSSNSALPDGDPDHAQRVRAFQNDAGAVSPETYDALMKAVNPDGMNANAVRDAMAQIYKFYAAKGDRATASKAAGGVLQAARARSRDYGKMAGDALQQRNYPFAARALAASYNEMPDGKRISAEVNEQGEGHAVVYDNDTDKPVEQFPLNPRTLGVAAMRAMAGGDFYYMLAQQTAPRPRGRSPVNAG